MAEVGAHHAMLSAIVQALESKRFRTAPGVEELLRRTSAGLLALLGSKSLSNDIFSKLSLEQQFQKLKALTQPKLAVEGDEWSLVSEQWLGKRPQRSRNTTPMSEKSDGEEEEGEGLSAEEGEEDFGDEEGFGEEGMDDELESDQEELGPRKARKVGKDKAVEDAEAELERQMQEYIDELNEQDEREGILGDGDDDAEPGLDKLLSKGKGAKKGKLAAGKQIGKGYDDEEMEDAEIESEGMEEDDDEENAVIRARPGAKYEKDDIDDEEYEKLLRQEMDQEELEEYEKKKGGDEGEEEEDGLGDDVNEEEIENGIFNEMRSKSNAIQEQEQKLLSDKPWQMKGEIRGHERPKDALVSVDVDFQRGVELKPQAPAKASKDIEKMIEQRILKEAFDDPRPVIVKQDLSWKQNFEELNFERDSRGLAALYEDEYKKNILGLPVETKEQKLHKEILKLYREISNTLDNLTNASFVPMPVLDIERKNKKDIETIKLEEKIPITVKSVDALTTAKAVFDTNHKNFIQENEKTATDNQRDRRIAKRKIRNILKDKRAKELVKTLDYKGQTKHEYNLVNRTKKAIEHEHANSSQPRTNMTKSGDLFKVLQENSERRKKADREVIPQNVQASKLKKLKL